MTRLTLLALLLTPPALAADAPPAAPAPAATQPRRPERLLSAEVAPDRRVTFRLRAPKATDVTLAGQWSKDRPKFTRDANGDWFVTTDPVPPGVHEYSFVVDGLTMIDPGNPAIKPMRDPRTSILHLPADPPALHDFQDVPHGVVRQHTYRSKSLGKLRELVVYTPPNYDRDPAAKFPTLYLQHGSGDNQATWTAHGKAHWIADNLLAQDKARPMVIVMMDGHAAANGPDNAPAFERDLLEDVMPFVESAYRVKTDPASRAIVGLSMGGGQSLTIGLNHPEKFAYVGGFSSAVAPQAVAKALDDPAATNAALKLLYIACGKDDFLLKRNLDFIATLKDKSIKHDWHETEGNHSWPVWRIYLADFLPRLFQ